MKAIYASGCVVALVAACGSPPLPEPAPAPLPVQQPMPAAPLPEAPLPAAPVEWAGFIAQAPGSVVEGTAMVHAYPTRTIVFVRVRGVQGDEGMPWHLHEGSCDNPGGAVMGPESGYPLLRPGPEPTVESYSELFGISLNTDGQYKVDVHAGLMRDAPVVACANLTRRP
jgi:hypothetical protein